MKICVCESYDEMSEIAAGIVAEIVKNKPDAVLGLATGSSPLGMYERLAAMNQAGALDFSKVTTVNLDEYYPITPDNPQSYRYFMDRHFFDNINIDRSNTHVPDGTSAKPEEACAAYEQILSKVGPADIQVLGIGRNGHIGFNEPAEMLEVDTHVTGLTQSTIQANARFFESERDVPTMALTMGIGTILRAKKIIIIAGGAAKREAVAAMLTGKLTTACPASLLNLHSDVTLICDREALPQSNLYTRDPLRNTASL